MKISSLYRVMLGTTLLVSSGAALAIGGCVDSPENPTALLALLAGGAAGYPWVRGKLSAFRQRLR